MRLTTFNKIKSHWANKISSVEYTSEDIENICTSIELLDYNDPTYTDLMEEVGPEEYRNELVAWLREEYL